METFQGAIDAMSFSWKWLSALVRIVFIVVYAKKTQQPFRRLATNTDAVARNRGLLQVEKVLIFHPKDQLPWSCSPSAVIENIWCYDGSSPQGVAPDRMKGNGILPVLLYCVLVLHSRLLKSGSIAEIINCKQIDQHHLLPSFGLERRFCFAKDDGE